VIARAAPLVSPKPVNIRTSGGFGRAVSWGIISRPLPSGSETSSRIRSKLLLPASFRPSRKVKAEVGTWPKWRIRAEMVSAIKESSSMIRILAIVTRKYHEEEELSKVNQRVK